MEPRRGKMSGWTGHGRVVVAVTVGPIRPPLASQVTPQWILLALEIAPRGWEMLELERSVPTAALHLPETGRRFFPEIQDRQGLPDRLDLQD